MNKKLFSLCIILVIFSLCTTVAATNLDDKTNSTVNGTDTANNTITNTTIHTITQSNSVSSKIISASSTAKTNNSSVSSDSSVANITQNEEKVISTKLLNNVKSKLSVNKNLTINGTVASVYNASSDSYVGDEDDAIAVKGANISLYSLNGSLIKQVQSNAKGFYEFKNLATGNYILNFTYKTYAVGTERVNLNKSRTVDYVFIPDIALITYASSSSTGQFEKVNLLKNMSQRVYLLESYDLNGTYDSSDQWMLDYANFILVDMYAQGQGFSVDTALIASSPASKNGKVAYTFGIYDEGLLQSTNWNFLGGSPHSLENTYIGSYWQAQPINDTDVLKKNMRNMFDYILYLIGDSKVNPTLNKTRTPLLSGSMWGIYYPGRDVFGKIPSQVQINQWIKNNPGYNYDGSGSLNWYQDYNEWSLKNNNPKDIFKEFETWYDKNVKIKGPFVVIVSYDAGGVVVDALIKELEKQGRATFNLFQELTTPPMASLIANMSTGAIALKHGVSSVISLYSFSTAYANMTENLAVTLFKQANVTILNAIKGISKTSYESEIGPQAEWTYSVVIPQFEGIISEIPVSYTEDNNEEVIINSGISKIVQLANGWARLKDLSNSKKKIAILLYNYPPGKANIGASYLDVFQSLHDLLEHMSDAGYNIGMSKSQIPSVDELFTIVAELGNKGSWAQGLLNQYVKENYASLVAHGQLINKTQYQKWVSTLPKNLQEQLYASWGDIFVNSTHKNGSKSISMLYNNESIVVPGVYFGNIFISVQPARGWEEVQNYHDTSLAPPHAYVAFYEYLNKVYDADAILSMGTHGTLEWLPGHTLGMQETDWSFQLTECPIIYPYIVSNPGEGMTAKERSFAQVISHMTPVMAESSLYGDYVSLTDYIDKYDENVKLGNDQLAEEYKNSIIELAEYIGFSSFDESTQTFDAWLLGIHSQLESMDTDTIALGLHSLGYVWNDTELITGVTTIASSRTTALQDIMVNMFPIFEGQDYYELVKDRSFSQQAEIIHDQLVSYITLLVEGNSVKDVANMYNIRENTSLYEDISEISNIINNILKNMEWNSIMNALSGGYVEPGLSADPSYGDVLPTGRSIYSSDTSKMPSKSAWASAKKIVDSILRNYYENNAGSFPELVSIVMWGTELLRTEGIGIAEFLYYLGVEPIWDATGAVQGVELIPLENLTLTLSDGSIIQRPRIDVLTTIVSSNPSWIKMLNDAVALAAFSNGTHENVTSNYILKHYREYPSLDRVFGLRGAVLEGTGVSDLAGNIADWQDADETISYALADTYLSRVSYSWKLGSDGTLNVTNQSETFRYLLSHLDLVTQNLDSSWTMLDSDDYADWFGGLLNAANVLGATPNTQLIDIRDKNSVDLFTLTEQLEKEVRTKLLSPEYLQSLQSGPSGWTSLAEKMENLMKLTFGTQKYQEDAKGNAIAVSGDGKNSGAINNNLFRALANALSSDLYSINNDYAAYAFQSMAGWLLTAEMNGYVKLTQEQKEALANKYVYLTTKYNNIACCHHTCKNIVFNKWILTQATVSNDLKRQFSDILKTATNYQGEFYDEQNPTPTATDNNYDGELDLSEVINSIGASVTGSDVDGQVTNPTGQTGGTSAGGTSGLTGTGMGYSDSLEGSNGTSSGNSGNNNAQSAGSTGSASGNSTTSSSIGEGSVSTDLEASSSEASAAAAGSSSVNAYEVTKKKISRSAAQESEVSAGYIVTVILIALLFFIGFRRKSVRFQE